MEGTRGARGWEGAWGFPALWACCSPGMLLSRASPDLRAWSPSSGVFMEVPFLRCG